MKKTVALTLMLVMLCMNCALAAEESPVHAAATLDGYHFFLTEGGELAVTDLSGSGGVLPDAGDAIRAKWIQPRYLSARWESAGTIAVTVEDVWTPEMNVTFVYSVSQLDGITGSGGVNMFDVAASTHDGQTALGLARVGAYGEAELIRWPCTGGSARADTQLVTGVPWSGNIDLLPYNGRTFLVLDRSNLTLYASEDGRAWTDLSDTFLSVQGVTDDVSLAAVGTGYGLTWTGEYYLSCRRVVEGRYGMMGFAGGHWYDPYSTQVCVLNTDFNLVDSYDFGRQVLSVGCWDGAWYAQVADDPGVSALEYRSDGTSTLYVSRDSGENWQATDLMDIMRSLSSLT